MGCLALFNFSKKKKISETYYFHCNERSQTNVLTFDSVSQILFVFFFLGLNVNFFHYYLQSVLPDFAPAIFKVNQSSQDIFFVLRIEKILHSDMDTIYDIYTRSDLKAKEKEKYSQNVQQAAARYSYWQPFCWACAPLFGEDGKIPDSIVFKPLYKMKDQDLLDINLCGNQQEGKVRKGR